MSHVPHLLLLGLLVLAAAAQGGGAGPRLSADEAGDIETLFSRAGDDPDAVVPLLVAGSKHLISLPADRAAAIRAPPGALQPARLPEQRTPG
jgi:hypothetical protein